MFDDQKALGSIATTLSNWLAYFRRLDKSQRVLSRLGEAEIVNSQEFLPMIKQLNICLEDKYGALLSEFFSTWVSTRSQLLHAQIKIKINRIQITHQQVPDLISLATTGCNYMRSVCATKWNLFKSFFQKTGEEELFVYLESLCDYLYDLLRPQILHEQKLDLLCHLATIFNFSTLLKPILQDIQTRLIFRAQAIIQTKVANYMPKHKDLDYPNKLIQTNQKRRQSGQQSKRTNNPPAPLLEHPHAPLKSRLPAEGVQENWYPTLRKTLWILSRLHMYVNDAIFQNFAGEVVGICSESIIKASNMMNSVASHQASSTTPAMSLKIQANLIDRELFVIRHLLILKEMIQTLDVVQVKRAVNLGSITNILKEILNPSFKDSLIFKPIILMNKLKSLNHSQIEFSKRMQYSSQREQDPLSVDEHHLNLNLDMLDAQITKTIDSKSDVDLKLKTICHQFILKSSGGQVFSGRRRWLWYCRAETSSKSRS
ncbi:hypothetical protein PtA15_17A314 [Puccinia triticina]|uniref:Conserved oligomeric Golgi complex subunit 3 C-terminal domain-containing protein n=1 Tax=Puccinia triticina TaxID=208348 RepID=A0ABY7DCY8_9BASI|nr:uncharacterized protein PtA15_17A314 [Puccinia triticina]WAQ92832.1 hypothetical protein PtA15_17A314 [Puccinia triticina]